MPEPSPGKIVRTGAKCGACLTAHAGGTRFGSTYRARRWFGLHGWRHLPPLGWVCPTCITRRPSPGPGFSILARIRRLEMEAADRKRIRLADRRARRREYMRGYRARIRARGQGALDRIRVTLPPPST